MKPLNTYYIFILLLFCQYSLVSAQTGDKIHLTITDVFEDKKLQIDTLIPSYLNVNKVLSKLGYALEDVKLDKEVNRKTWVNVEEVVKLPQEIDDLEMVDIKKLINVPDGATVIDIPNGKEILEKTAYEKGSSYTNRHIVKFINTTIINEQLVNDNPTTVAARDSVKQRPLSPVNQYYLNQMSSMRMAKQEKLIMNIDYPSDISLTTFKNAGILKTDSPSLLLEDFMIRTDNLEGHFRLTFNIKEKGHTTIAIYDMIGNKLSEENLPNFSGLYNMLLTDFPLFKRGSFIIVITQLDQEFIRKFTIKSK